MFEFTRSSLTIPFLVIALSFITAEIFISKKKSLSLYQAKDSLCNFIILVVGKLGFIEGWVNTPSAHRMHHGRNDIYIDKNFGGVLIVWDRLFGTYQAETEVPQFIIPGDFESHNPITVQFHNIPGYNYLVVSFRRLTPLIPLIFALLLTGTHTQVASAQALITAAKKPLEGRVEQQDEPQQNLMQGLWKANIKEFARHPRVSIESQNGNQLQGTYKGLIGKFPLTGLFDEKTGAVKLYVDFTRSRFFNARRAKQMVAILDGTLSGNTITGTAFIPEFGDRRVHFEARRDGRSEVQ